MVSKEPLTPQGLQETYDSPWPPLPHILLHIYFITYPLPLSFKPTLSPCQLQSPVSYSFIPCPPSLNVHSSLITTLSHSHLLRLTLPCKPPLFGLLSSLSMRPFSKLRRLQPSQSLQDTVEPTGSSMVLAILFSVIPQCTCSIQEVQN